MISTTSLLLAHSANMLSSGSQGTHLFVFCVSFLCFMFFFCFYLWLTGWGQCTDKWLTVGKGETTSSGAENGTKLAGGDKSEKTVDSWRVETENTEV